MPVKKKRVSREGGKKKAVPAKSSGDLLARVPDLWKKRFRVLGQMVRKPWPLCLVGGCVRDLYLRRPPLDWDVVSEGPVALLAKEAANKFSARLIQHPAFLTYTLEFPDATALDIATARKETYPHPASLPVVEPATLEDDFRRRDFTANAMAVHLTPDRWGQQEDPFEGKRDLESGVIRALHDKSFEDDPTRIYRAARYAGRLGWQVEEKTREWIAASVRAGTPQKLSPARIRHELERILSEARPAAALGLIWEWGAWTFLGFGTWNSSLAESMERDQAPNGIDPIILRLMLLCRSQSPSEAEATLKRLEFPRATTEMVSQTLKLLRLLEQGKMDFSQASRLSPVAQHFLKSSLADREQLRRLADSEPLLKGQDLQDLGYPAGPVYQNIFRSLREARWNRTVRSRADEIRHVVDNFPRKK